LERLADELGKGDEFEKYRRKNPWAAKPAPAAAGLFD
jgi:hypothetical protein